MIYACGGANAVGVRSGERVDDNGTQGASPLAAFRSGSEVRMLVGI